MRETETDAVNTKAPSGTSPFQIFDRERHGHPWERAFKELGRPDPRRRWAVVANWRMDHRVSEGRETDDLEVSGHFDGVADGESWWETRGAYFQEEICLPAAWPEGKTSAYCRATNSENLVSARVAIHDKLVHVGSLNAIVRRISRSGQSTTVDQALRILSGKGLPVRRPQEVDWFAQEVSELADALSSRGEAVVRQAAGLLSDAMGRNEPPWWAAFAEEVDPLIEQGQAADLCTALGLGHRSAGEWLITWKYPVSEVLPLYRPTSVEADASPFHFPSPPGYDFGITMPLDPRFSLCREVLHQPLRGVSAVDSCTGRLLSLEKAPTTGDNETLAALRTVHRQRLEEQRKMKFEPALLKAWLDRHS